MDISKTKFVDSLNWMIIVRYQNLHIKFVNNFNLITSKYFIPITSFYNFLFIYLWICKETSPFSIMYFVGKICNIFNPQYLDIFLIVFICKARKIILYELSMIIILNMPYIYVALSVRLVMLFSPTTRCFLMCFYL